MTFHPQPKHFFYSCILHRTRFMFVVRTTSLSGRGLREIIEKTWIPINKKAKVNSQHMASWELIKPREQRNERTMKAYCLLKKNHSLFNILFFVVSFLFFLFFVGPQARFSLLSLSTDLFFLSFPLVFSSLSTSFSLFLFIFFALYDTKQSDGEACGISLHCHRSQVHSGPEW